MQPRWGRIVVSAVVISAAVFLVIRYMRGVKTVAVIPPALPRVEPPKEPPTQPPPEGPAPRPESAPSAAGRTQGSTPIRESARRRAQEQSQPPSKGEFVYDYILSDSATSERDRMAVEINRASPRAVSSAAQSLGIDARKTELLLKWDHDFHEELWRVWHPPPQTAEELRKANHAVRVNRELLDAKAIELLGLDLANKFNASYSAEMNRIYFQHPSKTVGPDAAAGESDPSSVVDGGGAPPP